MSEDLPVATALPSASRTVTEIEAACGIKEMACQVD